MEKYDRGGVTVRFQRYWHPAYGQLFGEFVPNLSVIDLLLNHGPRSQGILRGES